MVFELHPETETIQHHIDFVEPPVLGTDATLRDAFEFLRGSSDGCVLICREKRLVGIFTERDALRLMCRSSTEWDSPLKSFMVSDVNTVSPATTVKEAINKMYQGKYRHLPIVNDDHHPVGLLKVSHILRYLVQHVPKPVYNLPPEPHPTMQAREGA